MKVVMYRPAYLTSFGTRGVVSLSSIFIHVVQKCFLVNATCYTWQRSSRCHAASLMMINPLTIYNPKKVRTVQ